MSKFNKYLNKITASTFPKYPIVTSEPLELTECKRDSVIKAQESLESCKGLTSRASLRQCIAKSSKVSCKKHNECSLKLGFNEQLLDCNEYISNSISIFKEELSHKLNKSKAFSDPTIFNKEIRIGTQKYDIQIADTPVLKKKGLMYNSTLKDNQGVLFVFDGSEKPSLWMFNTPLDLTVIWFNDKKRIIEIQDAEPCMTKPCDSYEPSESAKYALEVKRGTFHGDVGDFFFQVGNDRDFADKKRNNQLDSAIDRIAEAQTVENRGCCVWDNEYGDYSKELHRQAKADEDGCKYSFPSCLDA